MMSDEDLNIKYLFEPRSIAVVRASKDQRKIGHAVLHNIQSGRFAGKIYPVNPADGDIEGIQSYKSITNIEDDSFLLIPMQQQDRSTILNLCRQETTREKLPS